MGCPEFGNDGRQEIQQQRVAGGNPKRALRVMRGTGNAAGHTDDIEFDTLAQRAKLHPFGGQLVACATPVKQGNAQRSLGLRHAARHRRGIDAELFGRQGPIAAIAQHFDDAQVIP